jgi:plasmid stabilization system protein ParE
VRTNFRVEIGSSAKDDVQAIHDHIALDKRGAATKWVREFYRHVRSLRETPFGYEVIPEVDDLSIPFRHLLHGNYRIIYRVYEEQRRVLVVRVIHAARILRPCFFR